MIESLENLGLDPERVKRLRDASFGLGRGYEARLASVENKAEQELLRFAAATHYRRAAAHSLLLGEPDFAGKLFAIAAVSYTRAGSAYGAFLENLSREPTQAEQRWSQEPRNAGDVFFLWGRTDMDDAFVQVDERRLRLRGTLERFRTERIGVLGMPITVYLDVFDSLMSPGHGRSLEESLLPIVSAYSVALRRARSDRYHWTRLAIPFHPAEPDVVALLVAVGRALRRRDDSLYRALGVLPLGSNVFRLLRGVLTDYDAWGAEH